MLLREQSVTFVYNLMRHYDLSERPEWEVLINRLPDKTQSNSPILKWIDGWSCLFTPVQFCP